MPPLNVLPSAMESYQAACRPGGDPRTHLIDLGAAASTHLTGFRFTKEGRFDATEESADGIHPTVGRHAQLGEMLYERVAAKLLATEEEEEEESVSEGGVVW